MSLNRKYQNKQIAVLTEKELQEKFGANPSPVIQAALAARAEYLAQGGKPLSDKEINAEVALRRGGNYSADE